MTLLPFGLYENVDEFFIAESVYVIWTWRCRELHVRKQESRLMFWCRSRTLPFSKYPFYFQVYSQDTYPCITSGCRLSAPHSNNLLHSFAKHERSAFKIERQVLHARHNLAAILISCAKPLRWARAPSPIKMPGYWERWGLERFWSRCWSCAMFGWGPGIHQHLQLSVIPT